MPATTRLIIQDAETNPLPSRVLCPEISARTGSPPPRDPDLECLVTYASRNPWVMRHRTYETPQVSARSKAPGVELLSLTLVAGTQVLDCVANFVLVESLSLHVQPNAVFNV